MEKTSLFERGHWGFPGGEVVFELTMADFYGDRDEILGGVSQGAE